MGTSEIYVPRKPSKPALARRLRRAKRAVSLFAPRRVPLRCPLPRSPLFARSRRGWAWFQVPIRRAPDTEVRPRKDGASAGRNTGTWVARRRGGERGTEPQLARQAPLCSHRSRVSPHHMPKRMWLRSNNWPAWKGALTGPGTPEAPCSRPNMQQGSRSHCPTPCKSSPILPSERGATARPREKERASHQPTAYPPPRNLATSAIPSTRRPARASATLQGHLPPIPDRELRSSRPEPALAPSELSIAFFFCSSSAAPPPPRLHTREEQRVPWNRRDLSPRVSPGCRRFGRLRDCAPFGRPALCGTGGEWIGSPRQWLCFPCWD